MQYDYNGYTDWNMILDPNGGPNLAFNADAAVIANPNEKEFLKQPIFYIYGHFSKYVRPDSIRIDAKVVNYANSSNLTVVAFERSDKINAVIIYNG